MPRIFAPLIIGLAMLAVIVLLMTPSVEETTGGSSVSTVETEAVDDYNPSDPGGVGMTYGGKLGVDLGGGIIYTYDGKMEFGYSF